MTWIGVAGLYTQIIMARPVVTLLSDFGTRDYYVGALKGTLLRLAPETRLVDITHEVAPGDILEAAFLLEASRRHFAPGTIHLAVVDPGVGSKRDILAARDQGALFVAPDNGLLSFLPEDAETRRVDARDLFLEGPGATFHGRDRFAPVAAYLARGEPLESLGRRVESPVRLAQSAPRRGADFLEGRIVHIDRFGNLVSDIPSRWLPSPVPRLSCRLPGLEITRTASHYAELEEGEAALIPGSLGTLEISCNGRSAAAATEMGRGRTLRVDFR